jgi:ligand-binding sensor domain-containing protein/nitrogen-specific signal transduction histidine kinase/DNA-binding NarL/FixJ family response regulator
MIMNVTMNGFVKILFFLISCISFLNAQQIKRLDTGEGLVYGTVNVFEKDSLGFMWIGTNQGLNKYSGSGFKNYQLGKKYRFKGQKVIDILNFNGDLYIISNNGSLFKYDYKKDDFKLLKTFKNKKFLSLISLNESKLLIGMYSGFVIYDIPTNSATGFQHEDLFLNRVMKSYKDKIYVGSPKGLSVFKYHKLNDKLEKVNHHLKDKDVIHFDIDKKGNIWVGTEVSGLYKINGSESEKVSIGKNLKKNYAIRMISFDKNENILAAVDRLGLFVINQDKKVINTYSHDPDNENSISQNSIYSIYTDNNNAIWLGLREGGVNVIYDSHNTFNNIKHVKNLKNSIANNNIRSIYQTKNSTIWFGTENGISKYYNGQWTNFNKSIELYNTAILAIAEYDNTLLLGTYGEGLLELDRKTGQVSPLNLETQKTLKFIFDIYADDNALWVSSSDGSLNYYKNSQLINNFRIGTVRDVEKGFDDIVYAISDIGLFKINKRNNSSRKIDSDIFNSVNIGYSLNLDPYNNCLWIGAKKGLYKYNLKDDNLIFFNQKITDDIGTIYSLQRDNMQNLFLGTISGLWKYDIKNDLYRKYGQHDGLKIENFGVGASTQFEDGTLAFGGPKGAVTFDPADLKRDQPIENVFITDFKVNGKTPDTTIIRDNINYTDQIKLSSNENSLAFRFETLKFHGSNRNLFEWQLIGEDSTRRRSYGNKEIIYSNLSPGNYELNYTAYNASGINAENEKISFIIKKPFWNTWWAYIGYVLLVVSFIYLIIKISEAKNQKRFNENRIKYFVDVAHDIRTPVSLIQLLVKQLANQEDTRKSIELIMRNTQNLNEYVNQLLDFQKIDQKQLKLQVTKIDLKDCFLKIIDDFSPLIKKKSLNVKLEVKHIPVWFDGPKMNRIFYNLISNAIKYTNEGGTITIKSFQKDKKLKIDLIDNGIGIPEKQQDQIFNRFTRGTNVTNKGIPGTGIGLMLSKKIVELHGGNIILKSKENVGTKFTILLPNSPEQYKEEQLLQSPQDENDKDFQEIIEEEKLILLVEDNDELRNAIAKELKSSYKVIEGKNGKEGLLLALSKNPDLIITDIMMPKMDGKEMCHILKTNLKTIHIPIIMLTALADVDDKIKGLETGANAYVEKPLNVSILKATISNLIKSTENINYILENKTTDKKLTPDESFLSEIVDVIKENIKEQDFSIDSLCEIMGLSRSNLFRKLKKLINMSPSNLIIKIKLNHAQDLMNKKTFTRISDIAYESGFGDPKYFSTIFKKNIGKTPKEFMDES